MHALPPFLIALAITACSQDNSALHKKLDQLQAQLTSIEQKVGGARGNAGAQRQRRPEPDVKDVFAVSVDGSPSVGPSDALVTLVEGYEYACPACDAARGSVAQMKEKYGDKLRVVYKQYIVHPDVATNAALAVCAAHRQDKFAEMDRLLWEKGYKDKRDFSQPKIEAFATEAGLDLARFKTDVAGSCRDAVMRDHNELQSMGQGGTPTFYINGRYVVGGSPAKLGALIDEELALASKRVAEGTAAKDYYRTWVLGKGLKRFDPPRS